MNCPRCKTPVGPLSDPDAIVTCPGCGSRLMTRAAALRSQGGPKKTAGAKPDAGLPPPSATLPPTALGRLGLAHPPPGPPPPGTPAPPPPDPPTARSAPAVAAAREAGPVEPRPVPALAATLERLLEEVRSVRETQGLILESIDALRRTGSVAPVAVGLAGALPVAEVDDERGPSLSPIRARKRRSVLLVDDDPRTRGEAVRELEAADIPVRVIDEGNAALAAIAEDKPDAIALEIALGGDMTGKDLVNMIKATMEWVDIPIVLWTREAISSQREAQQIHGADEVVLKSGGAAALVARVITVFRRS